jgi:hypothetical protein
VFVLELNLIFHVEYRKIARKTQKMNQNTTNILFSSSVSSFDHKHVHYGNMRIKEKDERELSGK